MAGFTPKFFKSCPKEYCGQKDLTSQKNLFSRIFLFETMIKSCNRLTNFVIFFAINRQISQVPLTTDWWNSRLFCFFSSDWKISWFSATDWWISLFFLCDRLTTFLIFSWAWSTNFTNFFLRTIDKFCIFFRDQLAIFTVSSYGRL